MIEKLLSRVGIEVWKDLPGYEGHYRVSNLGNVKILKRNIISKSKTKISLHLNLKYKNFKISQLIAMAFLNHTPCGHILVVDHIDNDNTNNNLYNIQVISHRKNLSKDKKGNVIVWDGDCAADHMRKKYGITNIMIDKIGSFIK